MNRGLNQSFGLVTFTCALFAGFAIMIISIPLMLADGDSIGVDLPQSSRTGSGTSAPVSIEDGADNPHEKEIQPEQSQ